MLRQKKGKEVVLVQKKVRSKGEEAVFDRKMYGGGVRQKKIWRRC